MNEREFYEVCYDRFKHEQSQADAIYQRASILLVSLPILGAGAYKLAQAALLSQTSASKLLFYALSGASAVCLAASGVFFALSVCPRRYESLPPMKKWKEWRDAFRGRFASSDAEPDEKKIGAECVAKMIEKIVDAEYDYYTKNEIRRRHFRRSILCATFAMVGIGIEAFFHVLLHP